MCPSDDVIDPSSDYAVSNTKTANLLADLKIYLIFGIGIPRNQNMSVPGRQAASIIIEQKHQNS